MYFFLFFHFNFNCKTICIIWTSLILFFFRLNEFLFFFFNFQSLSPCFHLKWSFIESTWAQRYNSLRYFLCSTLFQPLNLHIFYIYFRTETLAFGEKWIKISFFTSFSNLYQKYLQQNKRFFRTRTSHFTINFIVSKCTINLNLNTKFSHTFSSFSLKWIKVFRYTFAIFSSRVTYFARFEKRAICLAFKKKWKEWRISRHRNFHISCERSVVKNAFFFRTIDCRQSFLLSTNTFTCLHLNAIFHKFECYRKKMRNCCYERNDKKN